ncbi:ABC transporter permease [Candidatus Woesearchaeota archaeon]|nr:ABC transporter permease [Candidatus Woesearchaeota archaeon]
MRFSEIHTLWRRVIKLSLADKASILLSLVWPLFLIFILGMGFDSFVEFKSVETSYTAFLGPGIIIMMVFAGSAAVGNLIIKDKEGFIRELLVAPISRASIFVGTVLGTMTISFIVMIMVAMVFLEYIGALSVQNLLWTLLFMFLAAFVSYGGSVVISFLFRKPGAYQQFVALFSFVIVFLSGAFFPLKDLPVWMKSLAYANPITYAVDGLRGQLIGIAQFSLAADIFALIGFAVLFTVLGALFFRKSVGAA